MKKNKYLIVENVYHVQKKRKEKKYIIDMEGFQTNADVYKLYYLLISDSGSYWNF